MSVPQIMLLAFALWTLVVPLSAIAVYRWNRILRGLQPIQTFRADAVSGADWYRRAMRAHANCVENLPVFAVLVWSLYVLELGGPALDALSMAVLGARIGQTSVHIARPETQRTVSIRFAFFLTQFACFLAIGGVLVANLL